MTAAQVHHPNAVSVFDTVDGDECWLVMEYASADSLDKLLAAQEKLPTPPRWPCCPRSARAREHAGSAAGTAGGRAR